MMYDSCYRKLPKLRQIGSFIETRKQHDGLGKSGGTQTLCIGQCRDTEGVCTGKYANSRRRAARVWKGER